MNTIHTLKARIKTIQGNVNTKINFVRKQCNKAYEQNKEYTSRPIGTHIKNISKRIKDGYNTYYNQEKPINQISKKYNKPLRNIKILRAILPMAYNYALSKNMHNPTTIIQIYIAQHAIKYILGMYSKEIEGQLAVDIRKQMMDASLSTTSLLTPYKVESKEVDSTYYDAVAENIVKAHTVPYGAAINLAIQGALYANSISKIDFLIESSKYLLQAAALSSLKRYKNNNVVDAFTKDKKDLEIFSGESIEHASHFPNESSKRTNYANQCETQHKNIIDQESVLSNSYRLIEKGLNILALYTVISPFYKIQKLPPAAILPFAVMAYLYRQSTISSIDLLNDLGSTSFDISKINTSLSLRNIQEKHLERDNSLNCIYDKSLDNNLMLSLKGFKYETPYTPKDNQRPDSYEEYTKEVEKTLEKQEQAYDINFKKGQLYHIRGDSGTGKSVFLKSLLKKNPYCKGQANFDCKEKDIVFAKAMKVPVVSKDVENAYQYVTDHSAEEEAEVEVLAKRMGLNFNLKEKNYKQCSEGEYARLNLIHALMKKPKLLILDEIFKGMDVQTKNKALEIIKEKVIDEGGTVIAVEHLDTDLENSFLSKPEGLTVHGMALKRDDKGQLNIKQDDFNIADKKELDELELEAELEEDDEIRTYLTDNNIKTLKQMKSKCTEEVEALLGNGSLDTDEGRKKIDLLTEAAVKLIQDNIKADNRNKQTYLKLKEKYLAQKNSDEAIVKHVAQILYDAIDEVFQQDRKALDITNPLAPST